MTIQTIAQLKPDPKNARRHNPRNIGMIEKSLGEVGAARSIVIDEDGTILAGNGVIEAAANAGIERVQVVDTDGNTIVAVRRSGLTPEQKAKLALYDNRTGELAEWDTEALAEIGKDIDLGEMFTADELADIGIHDDAPEDPGPQIDRAEELQQKWQVQRGQVWEIGKHRLMCGDSTSAEDVARLMGGEKAGMVWTDPPYGVNYGEKLDAANPMGYRVRNIENDNLPADELEELIRAAFMQAASATIPGAALYAACPAGTPLPVLIASFTGSGFTFHWGLVWVKDQLVLGRGDYHFRHENILYGWKHDAAHYFTESRKNDSIFEVARPKVSEEHPTMKPPELVARMIENSSKVGWIVLDTFNGAGATMVAAEQTGRICYGMEIEPKYCAVTLERLAGMGLEPKLAG